MKKMVIPGLIVVTLMLFTPLTGWATNGMNMIGTGAVSAGMGGADVAVPAGCTAIAGNPAQLATTCNRVISLGGAFLFPGMEDTPSGGSKTENEFQVFPVPFIGYAQRIGTSRWSVGIGAFAQGGMGVDFQNVEVMPGMMPGLKDDLMSQVGFVRLSPTVAYNVTDKLTMGASLFAGYATLKYDFFPNTIGHRVKDLTSFTFSGRFGVNYQLNDKWSVGATYTTESSIDFDGGELTTASGVKYGDVKMDGFTWPRQVEAGVAYRATPKLLLAMDLSWINWSSAIKTVTVTATNPNNAEAPNTLNVPFVMEWDDQIVVAIGAEYELTEYLKIRTGYNYGNSPVSSANLSPLFPALVEHHATAGFTYTWTNWDFDFAYEHAFTNSKTNDGDPNPMTNPFYGSKVSHTMDTFNFMVSYRF
ncbi:MAG: outer membrane protein transport protein [Geobacteraceae bacterium]|nr:outer membrane protein transport protein [Geobacteraceae bacterium]